MQHINYERAKQLTPIYRGRVGEGPMPGFWRTRYVDHDKHYDLTQDRNASDEVYRAYLRVDYGKEVFYYRSYAGELHSCDNKTWVRGWPIPGAR